MSNYDDLEKQVLTSIQALDSKANEDYGALSATVYHALELGIMDRRTNVIDTLLPVLVKFERTAKALLSTLANDAIIFATKKSVTVCAILDREKARSAFLAMKEHWKVDKSWQGLLAYAKAQKNRKPKREKSLWDLFEDFLNKAQKKYTMQEICSVMAEYLPDEYLPWENQKPIPEPETEPEPEQAQNQAEPEQAAEVIIDEE